MVIFTGPKRQLVLMSLRPGEEIGLEVHDGDQILHVVDGEGFVVLDHLRKQVEKGTIVFVPAGVRHNLVNTDDEPLKLFTIFAPAQHAAGTVEPKKEEEARVEELEEGQAE
jgi:mannose-6-phosphate isomerase-like protein (cupin superfamily)